jgi:hypothetical protein
MEMVPRYIKLNPKALKRPFSHECGIVADTYGWPRLGDGEQEIGRWHAESARLFIDVVSDPNFGPYVKGSVGLLVTDRSIGGSFYSGTTRARRPSLCSTGHIR